jgi:predicted dehydrogenase
MLDLALVVLYRGKDNDMTVTNFDDVETDWASGFVRSSTHFVDALLSGETPSMSVAEAVKVLQLCFAVYQASDTRMPVDPRTITGSVTPAGWADW